MAVNLRLNRAYGFSRNALQQVFPVPIVANRAPTTSDFAPIGQSWIYSSNNAAYILVSIVSNIATWILVEAGGGGGVFSSLAVNPGPISLIGTTGINTSGSGVTSIGTGGTGAVHIGNTTGGTAVTGTLSSTGATTLATTGASASSLGNVTGTSSLGLLSGTGGTLFSTGVTGTITLGLATMTGTITIGASTAGQTVQINNASGANTTILGSTHTTSATTVNAGTGGLALSAAGAVSVVPATGGAASPAATATINSRVGVATFTGFTTANSGGVQAYTIVNSTILATSGVFVEVTNLNVSTNGAFLTVTGIIQAAGSIIVNTANNGAGALGAGDNVLISFWVIS